MGGERCQYLFIRMPRARRRCKLLRANKFLWKVTTKKIVNNSAICDARYTNIRRTSYRARLYLRRGGTLSFVGID